MSDFNFDEEIDRTLVPALKTHRVVIGDDIPGLFAAGVADMDFRVAPVILEAMERRLRHGIFGYETVPDGLIPALQHWLDDRHGLQVPHEQILRAPNALNSLATAVQVLSSPGDGVIVQPPVFFDFFDIIEENGRAVVTNPLALSDGRYEIDFAGLETLVQEPQNRILLLCNPHNPVGRCWTRRELEHIHDLCVRNDVAVISDELHGDIVFPGHTYTPFAALGPEAAMNSVTVLSPAKTFNIASCCCAFTVVANESWRQAFQRHNSMLTVNKNNAFANPAMEAAFRAGGPWLDAVVDYLHGNVSLVSDAIDDISGVRLVEPEATFLLWLDFRDLGLTPEDLHVFLRREARWALTRGVSFGQGGEGFMRLNIACPRERLKRALEDLAKALENRKA